MALWRPYKGMKMAVALLSSPAPRQRPGMDSCPVSGYGVTFLRRNDGVGVWRAIFIGMTMALWRPYKRDENGGGRSCPHLPHGNGRGWIPAFAGMTVWVCGGAYFHSKPAPTNQRRPYLHDSWRRWQPAWAIALRRCRANGVLGGGRVVHCPANNLEKDIGSQIRNGTGH